MLAARLLTAALCCFRAYALSPTLSVNLDVDGGTQTVDDSGGPKPAFDYSSIVRDIPRYDQIARRDAISLEGRMTPSGRGRYPKGVTGYGGQVWECPGPWWEVDNTGGKWKGTCKSTKIEPGKCYQSQWMEEAEHTFVPDRELTCSVWGTQKCSSEPKFSTEADLDKLLAYTPAERKRFANRTIGFVSGIQWPGVESFQTNWGIYWRVNVGIYAPRSFMCFRNGLEAGIGKNF